ncbi:MAG: glycosyltransferase [Firmicutes bacterium]|nr:glycosyltransferase [Bacillota bacterium]
MADVYLLAPVVESHRGVVTRLRRYTKALCSLGLTVSTQAYSDVSFPVARPGHIHLLDPDALVRTARTEVGRGRGDPETTWWPAVQGTYSLTLTSLCEPHGGGGRALFEEILADARAVVVPTECLARRLVQERVVCAERIHVVPTPLVAIDGDGPSQESLARAANLRQGGKPIVLCVGPVAPAQGLEAFLGLMEQVRYMLPDVLGVLVGPVLDPYFLRSLLPTMTRVGVAYAGAFDRDDMRAFYAHATVLFDGRQEAGLAASAGEALACGVPVVAHTTLWDRGPLAPGLSLYAEETQALRQLVQVLRNRPIFRFSEDFFLRAAYERSVLYKVCTMCGIDGQVTVG